MWKSQCLYVLIAGLMAMPATVQAVVLDVATYGASDSVSANAATNTSSINAAIADLISAGGGTLFFSRHTDGVYNVTSTKTAIGGTAPTFLIAKQTGASTLAGIRIIGEGITIHDTQTYNPSSDEGTLFQFSNVQGIEISGIKFDANAELPYSDPHGLTFLFFNKGCSRVRIDAAFHGGFTAVRPSKLQDSEAKSIMFDIRIDCDHVERPFWGERSGDLSNIWINADYSGRDFILSRSVQAVDLHVRTKNLQGASVLRGDGGEGQEDIRIWITDRESTSRVSGNAALILQFSDTSPETFRNIEVNLDMLAPSTSDFGDGFLINKVAGAQDDTIGRGHVIDGLTVRGVVDRGAASLRSVISMHGAFASPDKLRRIAFRDLSSSNSLGGIVLNLGDALQDSLLVENCFLPDAPSNKLDISFTPGGNRRVSVVGSTIGSAPNLLDSLLGATYRTLTVDSGAAASVAPIDQPDVAGYLIVVAGGGASAMFTMFGANHLVQKAIDTNNNFSVTANGLNTTNIYWNPASSRYEIQNNTGLAQPYYVWYLYRHNGD
jgi:hypothetical protein